MKTAFIPVALVIAACAGCSSPEIVQTGPNSYMVSTGGWPATDGFKCESEAYKAANKFCAAHKVTMATSNATVVDGEDFAQSAACKLIFTVTNGPAAK